MNDILFDINQGKYRDAAFLLKRDLIANANLPDSVGNAIWDHALLADLSPHEAFRKFQECVRLLKKLKR